MNNTDTNEVQDSNALSPKEIALDWNFNEIIPELLNAFFPTVVKDAGSSTVGEFTEPAPSKADSLIAVKEVKALNSKLDKLEQFKKALLPMVAIGLVPSTVTVVRLVQPLKV